MRRSIELISCIITIVVFVLLDVFMIAINFTPDTISNNPAAGILIIVIIIAIVAGIILFLVAKQRQKTKIRL